MQDTLSSQICSSCLQQTTQRWQPPLSLPKKERFHKASTPLFRAHRNTIKSHSPVQLHARFGSLHRNGMRCCRVCVIEISSNYSKKERGTQHRDMQHAPTTADAPSCASDSLLRWWSIVVAISNRYSGRSTTIVVTSSSSQLSRSSYLFHRTHPLQSSCASYTQTSSLDQTLRISTSITIRKNGRSLCRLRLPLQALAHR